MAAPDTTEEPRPEDFGVTRREVERTPELVITRHRPLIFITLYGVIFAAVFSVIFKLSDSLPASLTFAVILVAAGSIFLIPVVVCLLCASESLETRWLCRQFPTIRACLAYREALAAFKGRPPRPRDRPGEPGCWLGLSQPVFRDRVRRALERRGLTLSVVSDPGIAGYDFSFHDGHGAVVVRCEAEPEPIDIGVGRELSACIGEVGADRALLITPSGVTDRLTTYLSGRPIEVVDPVTILGTQRAKL